MAQLICRRAFSSSLREGPGNFYKTILASVHYSPNSIKPKVVDEFKALKDPSIESISPVVSAATFDEDVRLQCINELRYHNMNIYPYLYCGIMGGLIMHQSPDITTFHDQFFVPDKRYMSKMALATFKFGTLRSPHTTEQMIKLYDHMPAAAVNGLLDRLIQWWISMQVSRHVLPFFYKLIESGNFPYSEKSYDYIPQLVGWNPLDFTRAVVKANENGHAVPRRLINKTVIMANGQPAHQKENLQELIKLDKEYLDDVFWKLALRYLDKVPWWTIEKSMEQCGYKLQGDALIEYALRTRTVEGCQEAIEKFKSRNVNIPTSVHGHLVHLLARRDLLGNSNGKGGKPQEEALAVYESLKEVIGTKRFLAEGHMYGLFCKRRYDLVIWFHQKLGKKQTEMTWNITLAALCRKNRMNEAEKHVNELLSSGYKLWEEPLTEYVVGMVEYGRRVFSKRKKYISMPPLKKKGETPRPHNPFSFEHIFKSLDDLAIQGYIYPESKLPKLLYRMDSLQGISFTDTENIISKVVQLQLSQYPKYDLDPAEEVIVRFWRNNSENMRRNSRFAIFSYKEIKLIVDWGFRKATTQPWRAARLMANLRNLGVDIPKESVIRAYSELFRIIYGQMSVSGEYKRVREQIDPNLTLETVIDNVNKAWSGDRTTK